MHFKLVLVFWLRNKINSSFYITPSRRLSSLSRNATNGVLGGKLERIFLAAGAGGGGGGRSLTSSRQIEARDRYSPSTSLAFEVTTMVYSPPFQEFLDPPQQVKGIACKAKCKSCSLLHSWK